MLGRSGGGAGSDPATTPGIDIASYQHPNGAGIDWGQVAGAGQKFVHIKASEGNYYQNPYFAGDSRGAAGASMFHGGYHFAIPDASDGTSQADYALNADGYTNDGHTLPPMLDMEWDPYSQDACYGLNASQMVGWIAAFSGEVQRRTGRPPVIYTAAAWWNQCTGGSSAFNANPLDIASWGSSSPQTPGWSTWTFWQTTSAASVAGITGPVDADTFNGTPDQLAAFAQGQAAQQTSAQQAAPSPTPAPQASPTPQASPAPPASPAVGLYRGDAPVGTFSTIQAAVDTAQSGDTIKVPAGTYKEVVTINRSLALTFKGAQAGVPGNTHSGAESNVTGFTTSGSATPKITVDGFAVTPGASNNGSGIYAPQAGTSLTVQNSVLSGYQSRGAYVAGSSAALFHNDLFEDALSGDNPVGIELRTNASNVDVLNNAFSRASSGKGADVDVTAGPISRPSVRNNVMSGGATAVAMVGTSGAQISNNRISGQDPNAGILLGGGDQNTNVFGNSVSDRGAGVALDRSDPGMATNTGTLVVGNSLLRDATAIAVSASALSPAETVGARGNTITSSAVNGVANASQGSVDATRNWWGWVFGPRGTNGATGQVAVAPWCADARCQGTAQSKDGVVTVSNEPAVDLSMLLESNRVTLPSDASLEVPNPTGQLLLRAGTTIAGQQSWDGVVLAPTPGSTNAAPPAPAGFVAHVRHTVDAGSREADLQLSQPARVLIPGAAGQRAGWTDAAGAFHQITTGCSADSAAATANLAEGADCAVPVGTDEVIWTRHLSRFTTYTLDPVAATTSTTGSSSSGPAGGTGTATTPNAPANNTGNTGSTNAGTAGQAPDASTASAAGTPFTAGPAAPVLPFLPPLLLGALAFVVGAVLTARWRRS
ncbi:MAG: right-handed parallel beta-helix repeat-containing protein [Candidatus Dormibacteraeota bacterium]|nr:right-handed parallel beta-helix repeat-containing protein [Candidatus Dormibacteraeota bacterium]MBO0760989.1 right-handed parallel beta-helix repeat-containing protein [Candidatus Dormibacteraeota bacterium]